MLRSKKFVILITADRYYLRITQVDVELPNDPQNHFYLAEK
jgi:hypothetical protein